jgi:endoglucanase
MWNQAFDQKGSMVTNHVTRRRLLGGAMLAGTGLAGTGLAGAVFRDPPCPAPAEADLAVPAVLELPRPLISTERDQAEWQLFKRSFILPDGRVLDTSKGGVSHSEGQGWGLFFAVAFDDRPTFDKILQWTSRNLRRPNDALHAWCYRPGEANPVPDLNCATDGDLFIAAALARAAARWDNANYALAASAIAKDVLRLLVLKVGQRTILLPGAQGFDHPDAVVINPSYYALAIFPDLAAVAPSPLWASLRADGLALIADGRFGRWRLPPDWLEVSHRDGTLRPARNWPARFSYDAIRVPLYLSWAGASLPIVRRDFVKYFSGSGPLLPAWADLTTNSLAPYAAPPGMLAVAAFVTNSPKLSMARDFPSVELSAEYYSAALTLLSRIAWKESMRI